MNHENGSPEITPKTESPSNPTTPGTTSRTTNEKGGRPKKAAASEERVPVTLSVSAEFARRLKVVVSASEQSAGEYLESRLSAVVRKDLKRILEEMG